MSVRTVGIAGSVASAAVVADVAAAAAGDAVPKVLPMPVQVTTPRLAQNPLVATRSTASIWQHHASPLLSRRRRLRRRPRQSAATPQEMRDTGIPSTRCGPGVRRRAAARGAAGRVGAKSNSMSG